MSRIHKHNSRRVVKGCCFRRLLVNTRIFKYKKQCTFEICVFCSKRCQLDQKSFFLKTNTRLLYYIDESFAVNYQYNAQSRESRPVNFKVFDAQIVAEIFIFTVFLNFYLFNFFCVLEKKQPTWYKKRNSHAFRHMT